MCSYNVLKSLGTIESFGGEIASFFITGFCRNITFCFVLFLLFVLCVLLVMEYVILIISVLALPLPKVSRSLVT